MDSELRKAKLDIRRLERELKAAIEDKEQAENELKKRREEIRTFKRRVSELELSAATAPASASRSVSSRGASSRFRNDEETGLQQEMERLKTKLAAETKAREELQAKLERSAATTTIPSAGHAGQALESEVALRRELEEANKQRKEAEEGEEEALEKVRELQHQLRQERRHRMNVESDLETLKQGASKSAGSRLDSTRGSSRGSSREERKVHEAEEKLERLEREAKELERKWQEERKAKEEERRKREELEDNIRRLEREKRREGYSGISRRGTSSLAGSVAGGASAEEAERLRVEKEQLAAEVEQAKAELEGEREKRKAEEEKNAELEEEMEELEKKIKSLMANIREQKQKKQDPQADLELEKTLEKLRKQNEQLKEEIQNLSDEVEEIERKNEIVEKKRSMLQKELDEMESENERLRRDRIKLRKEVETLLLEDEDGSNTKVSLLMADLDNLRDQLDIEEEEHKEAENLHKQEMQFIEEEKADLEAELAIVKKAAQRDRAKLESDLERVQEERDLLLRKLRSVVTASISTCDSGASASNNGESAPEGRVRSGRSKQKQAANQGNDEEDIPGKVEATSTQDDSEALAERDNNSSKTATDAKGGKSEKPQKKVLIQLKGKNRIHVRQVELCAKSLNKADVYILDMGDKIYDWNGAAADRKKREKGVEVANRLSGEKRKRTSGKAKKPEIIILEDGHMEPPREFWDALGGRPDSIPTAPPTEDEKMEKQWEASDKLYRVNPGNELFPIESKFTKAKLDTKFNYIFDCREEMYYWCGKGTDKMRREENMKKAKELFAKTERPKWSTLKKINEGKEPVLFQEKFHQWQSDSRSSKKKSQRLPGGMSHAAALTAGNMMRQESNVDQILKEYEKTFTHQQLIDGDYPASLDTSKKEAYLSDVEFVNVFGMSKSEFARQPKWKQEHMKKSKDLF